MRAALTASCSCLTSGAVVERRWHAEGLESRNGEARALNGHDDSVGGAAVLPDGHALS